jgi:tRNA(fMet)-specific endonuclease VapC
MTRLPLALGLLATFAAPALAKEALVTGTPALLLHGNYCGPGNNAPAAPIDALDAACARHDACTPDGGLPSKACNMRLQADAERVASDPNQPEDLRTMAGLVASGAAMMPSASAGHSIPSASRGAVASRRAVPVAAGRE